MYINHIYIILYIYITYFRERERGGRENPEVNLENDVRLKIILLETYSEEEVSNLRG